MWIINRSKISGRNNGKFQGKQRGWISAAAKAATTIERAPPQRGIIYQFQLALNICRALARFTVMGHETRLFTELNSEIVGSGVGEKRKSSAVLSPQGGTFEFPVERKFFDTFTRTICSRTIPCLVCLLMSWRNLPFIPPEMVEGGVRVVFSDSNARRCGKEVYIYIYIYWSKLETRIL